MKKWILMLLTLMLVAFSSAALALDDQAVEAAARAYVPSEAVLQKVEMDDGLYDATFRVEASAEKYEVKVDASGTVVKLESKNKGNSGAKTTTLSADDVINAVQTLYAGAEVLRQDEDIDDGQHEIDVFFTADGLYGTLELNAETGALIEREIYFGQYAQNNMLTEEAARAVLASYKPDAVITKIELDEDDGLHYWEGDATMSGTRYEFSINAGTGELVEWERD